MTDLPHGWASVPVSDLLTARPSNGKSVPTAPDGFPVLRLTALRNETVDLAERKTGAWTAAQAASFVVRKGDLLLSRGNGSLNLVGRAALVAEEPDPVAYPDTIMRLTLCEKLVDSRYMVATWNSRIVRDQIESAARTTAGIHKINQRIVEQILIPLPPLAEQRRIIEVLDTNRFRLAVADSSTTAAEAKIQKIRRTRTDPANISPKVPRLPLGQILREPLRNGRSARRTESTQGIRALTLTAVTRELFEDAFTKIVEVPRQDIKDLWLEAGDIFVQRSNTADLVGSSALYRGASDWAIFPDLLIRVRPKLEVALPEYVLSILQAESTRERLRRSARGLAGSMPKIDQTDVATVPIPMLTLQQQADWVSQENELVASLGRLSVAIDAAHRKSRALSAELLAAAFRGDLVDQDPTAESVHELLAHVRIERETATAPAKKTRTRKAPPA